MTVSLTEGPQYEKFQRKHIFGDCFGHSLIWTVNILTIIQFMLDNIKTELTL